MTKNYSTGAIGALLDIYQQAITDLQETIRNITDTNLALISDPLTDNADCRSVQSILSHVLHSGFGYATSIYNSSGNSVTRPAKVHYPTTYQYITELSNLFTYTENIFRQLNDADLEQTDNDLKILTGWGQLYDIEQLMEHAIIHILRHQRQIQKMKLLF